MELSDFRGEHILNGVLEKDCGIVLSLDGITYEFKESGDGYRSYLNDILKVNFTIPCDIFEHHRVIGEVDYGDSYFQQEAIIKFISVDTGKVILKIGTHNRDSYYPSFVCEWIQENMKKENKNE